ncbi:MAG: hypothetical protein JOS17DRAFT_760713 [Linnemannia elongata]|nr:MAG: hypothetical protein JOS17DRAFT_760713 [Linnemannia elongata]
MRPSHPFSMRTNRQKQRQHVLLYCLVILPLLPSLLSLPSILPTWPELFLSTFSLLLPPPRRLHSTFPFCLPFCLLFLGNRQMQLREHKTTHHIKLGNPHYPKRTTATPNLSSLLHFDRTFRSIVG